MAPPAWAAPPITPVTPPSTPLATPSQSLFFTASATFHAAFATLAAMSDAPPVNGASTAPTTGSAFFKIGATFLNAFLIPWPSFLKNPPFFFFFLCAGAGDGDGAGFDVGAGGWHPPRAMACPETNADWTPYPVLAEALACAVAPFAVEVAVANANEFPALNCTAMVSISLKVPLKGCALLCGLSLEGRLLLWSRVLFKIDVYRCINTYFAKTPLPSGGPGGAFSQ